MEKSIYSPEYAVFLRCLIEARKRAGLTQAGVAERIKQTQSFVSKCERGERRLDFVEVDAFCKAMDISLTDFATEYAERIESLQNKWSAW